MPLVKIYKVAGQEQGLGLRSVVKWKISTSRFLHAGSIALSGTLQVTSENFMYSAWCKSSLYIIMFYDCTNSFRKLIKKVPPSVTERKYGFKRFRNVPVFIVRKVRCLFLLFSFGGITKDAAQAVVTLNKTFSIKTICWPFLSMILMRSLFFGFKTWLMETVTVVDGLLLLLSPQ